VAVEALHAGLMRRLVLTNGPVARADWALRLAGPLLRSPAGRALLRRGPVQAALASSAGGRRLVVNPYVMGRDTVASTTGSAFSSPARRAALRRLLSELSTWEGRPTASGPPVLLLWGDEDPLYPASVADAAGALIPTARHERIPGGQHLHVLERPWALADAARAWVSATSMS
jgi:pimeloyl-ACP methyl ester carboxylesterase